MKKVGLKRSVSMVIQREFNALDDPNGRLVAIDEQGRRRGLATDTAEATLAYLFNFPAKYKVTYSLAHKNGNILLSGLKCAWPHGSRAFESGCWNVCFTPDWWTKKLDIIGTIRVNRKVEVLEA